MDADYVDDLVLLGNTPIQAEFLLYSLEQAASGIGLQVKTDKTEYMCFNQKGDGFFVLMAYQLFLGYLMPKPFS